MRGVYCLNYDLCDSRIYRIGEQRVEGCKGGRRNGCLSEAGFAGLEDGQDWGVSHKGCPYGLSRISIPNWLD